MLATEPLRGPPLGNATAYSMRGGTSNSGDNSFSHTNSGPHSGRFITSGTSRARTSQDQRNQNLLRSSGAPGGGEKFSHPQSASFSTPMANNQRPQQENNIMNQRADVNSSLYMICLNLKKRLTKVPGFAEYIVEMEEEESETDTSTDPVTSMWNCLRRGYPLMTIYNAMNPAKPLNVDSSRHGESKIAKAATFEFLRACLEDLKFSSSECFLITDLYGGDTTGFVKVTKVVNKVLDKLEQRGLLLHTDQSDRHGPEGERSQGQRTQRQYTVSEMVTTERDYVHHLEQLQHFKEKLERTGAIAGDAVHDIFLNLNALLDFQRRFLIRIEQQNSLSESHQNWGQLFSQYMDSFRVYEPFVANTARRNETITQEWSKISMADVSLELADLTRDRRILDSFLMKPFQRLTKYPMLLKGLRDDGEFDEEMRQDLASGIAATKSVLTRVNDATDKQLRLDAVTDLSQRVDDWKGHKLEQFGELLQFGSFTVLKGEGAKEVEREVRMVFDALPAQTHFIISKKYAERIARHPDPEPETATSPSIKNLFSTPLEPVLEAEEDISDAESVFDFGTALAEIPPPPLSSGLRLLELGAATPRRRLFGRRRSSHNSRVSLRSTPSTTSVNEAADTPPRSAALSYEGSDGAGSAPATPSKRSKTSSPGALAGFGRTIAAGFSTAKKQLHRTPYWRLRKPTAWPFVGLDNLLAFNGTFMGASEFLEAPERALPVLHNPKKKRRGKARKLPSVKVTALEKAHLEFLASKEAPKADHNGPSALVRVQYHVYLFERILLCCKEMNPNKQRNRMLSSNKALVDKKGKLRLQLKGRIFMQNVTDVASLQKDGSYTVQIFWKGDPGVENFKIAFTNEETLQKWRKHVLEQKRLLGGSSRGSGQTGTSNTQFTYLQNHSHLPNPYPEEEDIEEDDSYNQAGTVVDQLSELNMSRNASSTSLRSGSNSLGSGGPMLQPHGRTFSSRLPTSDQALGVHGPPLTLHTNLPRAAGSPAERAANSYFSPTLDSPASVRSSSQVSMFGYPRQATPSSGWTSEESMLNTSPPITQAMNSEGRTLPNAYTIDGRTVTRPSLPAMTASQTAQQLAVAQSRLRSVSSPDIHNSNAPGSRRIVNGQNPPIDNVPVPPLPVHMAQMRGPNRSQNNSPINSQIPLRTTTQSPILQRDRVVQPNPVQYGYDQQLQQLQGVRHERSHLQSSHTASVPADTAEQRSIITDTMESANIPCPSQLKVKIWFDPHPSHVTIVVPIIIKHRSLIDRIDSKMEKISLASISRGSARLRYKDIDGDEITIGSDDDVQEAIAEWAESQKHLLWAGSIPDFELYWKEKVI